MHKRNVPETSLCIQKTSPWNGAWRKMFVFLIFKFFAIKTGKNCDGWRRTKTGKHRFKIYIFLFFAVSWMISIFPCFYREEKSIFRENEMAHDAKCLDCYFFIFCNKNREELRRLKMHKKQENIGLQSIFPWFLLFLESSQFFPVQWRNERLSRKLVFTLFTQNFKVNWVRTVFSEEARFFPVFREGSFLPPPPPPLGGGAFRQNIYHCHTNNGN